MKRFITIGIFAVVGCANLHPRTVSDAAHDLCVAVFSGRPEIIRQAKRQNATAVDVAKAACAANDVVGPFLRAGQDAGNDAMGHAERLGLVK